MSKPPTSSTAIDVPSSIKRMHNEDLSDRETGEIRRFKRGRRGSPAQQLRQSTPDEVMQEGACWRCKLLRLPCDDGTPCTQCVRTNERLDMRGYPPALGCHRDDLGDRLKDKIPSLPGFGSEEWFLPTRAGFSLRVRVKYADPTIQIQDVDLSNIRECPMLEFNQSIVTFLKQFHDLRPRWGMHYEEFTEDIIQTCAQIQEDIVLAKTRTTHNNLSSEDLVIASALRALALAHNYPMVTCHLPLGFQSRVLRPDLFLQPVTIDELDDGLSRSIEIWRYPSVPQFNSAQLQQDGGDRLAVMMEDIVRIAQRKILQRKPKDWPALFCLLCLLKLIQTTLNFTVDWVDHFNGASKSLNHVWSILCQLYHVSTKGKHPLTYDWDAKEYASLVRGDKLAVKHFHTLNEMWVGEESKEYEDDTLQRKMDRFLAGYDFNE